MKTSYLKLYKKWMKTGLMSNGGLCLCLEADEDILLLFKPTNSDMFNYPIHYSWLTNKPCYWASGSEEDKEYEFTPLRQTILLFMAAMNGEL